MNAGRFWKLLDFDLEEQKSEAGLLAGVDEVGRGPLAGPVVAAAVIFTRPLTGNPVFFDLNDSKQVRPRIRQILFWEIVKAAVVGVGVVDEKRIDEINIYQATRLAMKQAVLSLSRTPDLVLIDGKIKLDLPVRQKAVIGGDRKSAAIAAASIVAKVYRDGWMIHLDGLYPGYEFGKHKGYGTRQHLGKLREKGPSPIHRKSFSPVHQILLTKGLPDEKRV